MSRGRNVLWVHLLGALAVIGWAALAVASHHLQRPLPVFLATLAWQWLIFLAAWRVAATGELKRVLWPILAWVPAFLLCGILAKPLMEDDQFRFLWDGRQFGTTGNPYDTVPAAYFG